ncbi:MAG: flagellar hook-length control protein FliK [Spirochaetales bacterium]|nr:flagellar hook-length control protein FliK [Spirochaetales bacterium]
MLPVQMPMQRVEQNFDTSNSMMDKSVESDNLQGTGKFTEVFKSASSEYNKMQKSDVEQKSKSDVKTDKRTDKESDTGSVETSIKQLEQKNKKLISLRKVGSDNSKSEFKKTKNIDSVKKNITDISKESDVFEIESFAALELPADINSVVLNPEAKSLESLIAPDAVISDNLKSSVLLKTVSDEKKNSVNKKNIIKKDSKTTKAKISVLDLRQVETKNSKIKQAELKAENDGQKMSVGSSEQLRSDNAEEAKPIVIELTHVKDNFSSESKTLTTASSSALMKQLEENVNSKIVKQSSIILKDGGSGEIKLILKPEQLGSVRIRLLLTDNKLAGQIIVDSAAVKEIFEQNLQNLEKSFRDNGFDTAALNVSVGGDRSGSGNRENNSDIAKQIELIEEIIPTIITESENLVDLVV